MDNIDQIRAGAGVAGAPGSRAGGMSGMPGPVAPGKRPEEMNPQEIHAVLWQVLSFRDSGVYTTSDAAYGRTETCTVVVKKISKTIGEWMCL